MQCAGRRADVSRFESDAHIELAARSKMIALGVDQRYVIAIVEQVLDVERKRGLWRDRHAFFHVERRVGRLFAVPRRTLRTEIRGKTAAVIGVGRKPAAAQSIEQHSAGYRVPLLVIGRRETRRLSEARREELRLAAAIDRDDVSERKVGPAIERERLDVVKCFLRQAAQHVVDILVKKRDADLRVVNQVVGVLLPNTKPQVAGTDRDMPAELELRVAFGFKVELGYGRL